LRTRALAAGALLAGALLAASAARAQDARRPKDADLGQKRSVAPDVALEGSLEAKKAPAGPGGPALDFETFRQAVEVKVSEKRREEITSLQKLIKFGGSEAEMPGWYFRLAELLWEESQYFFFESGRLDDRIIALGKADPPEAARLQAQKRDLDAQSRRLQDQAVALYRAIIQKFPKYPRMDEVLFFLAENLTKRDRFDEDAMRAYRALIQKFPSSRYVPDSWMAFGEYYFERANKQDRLGNLRKALEAYRRAASYQESSVYGYAMYKQGWVHYNLAEWAEALDLFRAVIYFGELPTSSVPADKKLALVKEARKDYVRTYSHVGSPEGAADEFKRVGGEKGWMEMLKSLANLYFDEGKDRDAIVVYRRLIQEKPLSPESPFFQSRIVTCAGRMGKKEAAVEQAHVFVKMLRQIEAAAGKDEKDQKALADARRDAENTLRTLAVQYHNEWKKTRDEPVAGFAAAVYRDYLDVFPDAKTAYEMRFFYAELLYALAEFERAGAEYEKVASQDIKAIDASATSGAPAPKPGKFFKDALENTVFAYDVVAKKLDETEKRAPSDPKKRIPVVAQRQKLLDACLRYMKYQPRGDKWVEVAYKAANIYYRHNDFAQATDVFTRIALDHPESELAGYSTNLVLDAYNLLGDWRNVNGWAKRFYANAALMKAHPALKDDLARVIEQSAFKLIEEHERKRDYEAAADAYLSFVRDWPQSKLAPTALYNASVDLGKAHRLDQAVQVRDQLLARYPGDALAPKCVWDNAQSYEAIAEFERSAGYYDRYFRAWKGGSGEAPARGKKKRAPAPAPASASAAVYDAKKANDAIVNVAVFRAGLKDWAGAEAASLAYLATWPDGADAPRIFLSLADLYAKQGAKAKELKQLEDYQRRYAKDPDEWLAIQQRIAVLLEKSGRRADAERAYQVGLAYYRRNQSKVKERGTALAAEAMYRELDPVYAEYARIDFNVRPKDLRFQLERKKKRLVEVQQRYAAVVKLKQAEPAICALWRIALASSNFAQSLLEAPVPKEIRSKAEYVEEYKTQLAQAASPFETDAAAGAELALQAAREYGISSDCSRKAEQVLAKYKPDAVAGALEVPPRIAPAPVPARPRGYGLVEAIQPVPAPRPVATARRDEPALPPLRDAPPPEAAPAQAPRRSAAAPAAQGTSAARQAAPDPMPPRTRKGGAQDDDEDLLP
jgi:TolA-binding protein